MVIATQVRTLHRAPEPLGSYIRLGYNDHTAYGLAIAAGRGTGTGVVLNPVHADRQLSLVQDARAAGVETILDSKGLELSEVGGYSMSHMADLPWASGVQHSPLLLGGPEGATVIRRLGEFAAEADVSAIIAPAHFLESASSPWLPVDEALTHALRQRLNELEMRNTLLYYPLAMRTSDLLNPTTLEVLTQHLQRLPIDGIWLRLHPFGTGASGPLALARYLRVCRSLHALGIPLVAEHSGSVGVALLAFGAVGGIESGVTFGDTMNLGGIFRPPAPDKKSFLPAPRVYLHQLGAFLEPDAARAFFGRRGVKALHGCLDTGCCPRGWADMLNDPRGHFLRQRAREVTALSSRPHALRAGYYMESFLRPASDRATRAAELEPSLERVSKRLDSWRTTLGADLEAHSDFTVSRPASGRRLRPTA